MLFFLHTCFVVPGMCNEMYIASVVTDQLKPIENFLTYTEQTTLKVLFMIDHLNSE